MLLCGLFLLYVQLNAPSEAEIAEHQRIQDSIELVQNPTEPELATNATPTTTFNATQLPDSVRNLQLMATHGPFASAAAGEEQTFQLENDKMRVVFSSKGGKVKEVLLKEHFKILTDTAHVESKGELKLLEDTKNKFCLLYTSPSPRDATLSRMPSSA